MELKHKNSRLITISLIVLILAIGLLITEQFILLSILGMIVITALFMTVTGLFNTENTDEKILNQILRITENEIYRYEDENTDGNYILSKLNKKNNTYRKGIYAKLNTEWWEDPVCGNEYVCKKIEERYFLFHHVKETVE